MYCSKCGKKIKETDTFCPFCGDNTVRYATPQTGKKYSEDNQQTNLKNSQKTFPFIKPKRRGNGIILIIIAFAALCIVLKLKGIATPQKTFELAAEAMVNDETDKFIEYSTLNEKCQKELGNDNYDIDFTRKRFDDILKNTDTQIKINNVRILNKEEFDEKMCELEFYFKAPENIEEIAAAEIATPYSENPEYMYCLKVSGTWYVLIYN